MKIDFKPMISAGLNPNQYTLLYLMYSKKVDVIDDYQNNSDGFTEMDYAALEDFGYVSFTGITPFTEPTFTTKTETLLDSSSRVPFSDEWFDKWYDLWPKKIKSGGYLVRSGKPDCKKKMIKFIKDHKYSTTVIENATRAYVNQSRLQGYSYMKLASYFISKDGMSILASLCEQYSETKEVPKNQTSISYGGKFV